MIEPFIRHSSEILLETSIFTVRQDHAEHPKTGQERGYVVLEQADWVNIVAQTESGELVMIRQWRHGTRCVELEVPAGLIDPGESPLEAAARELREETGHVATTLEIIGEVAPNPAFQSNTCFTVFASGCRLTHATQFDADEDIEVELMSVLALRAAVDTGQVRNAMVICALFWAFDQLQ